MPTWAWIVIGAAVFLLLFFRPSPASRARVTFDMANRALKRRDWDAAQQLLVLAREIAAKIKDSSLRTQVEALCHLLAAELAYRLGNYETVDAELPQAVEKLERAQAPDRPVKLMHARQLWGDVHFDRDQHIAAIEQFSLAAAAVEPVNPPLAIFALQRWTDTLLDQGDYASALAVAERCVEAERKILANAKVSISMTAPDLALARRDFAAAEHLFREKAEHWGRLVPAPDNIDVTRYFFHLAAAQEAQGKLSEARATLERACDVARLDFCPEHPRVGKARRKLERLKTLQSV